MKIYIERCHDESLFREKTNSGKKNYRKKVIEYIIIIVYITWSLNQFQELDPEKYQKYFLNPDACYVMRKVFWLVAYTGG